MPLDPNRPFNTLPPLPPKARLETTAVLKAAIQAHRALAELKGVGQLIPNQSILVNAVALQEARLSSEIEGIITTNDALYRALSETSDSADDPKAKEVLRYSNALWHGYEQMKKGRPVSTRLYEEIVQLIRKNRAGVRKTPGTTLRDQRTNEIIYTPPEGENVIRGLLANLDKYLHDHGDGIEPLAKLAVIHYQFEAIHPFADGNGRTGRILNILYLVERGLLDSPILYLSRYIIENKAAYYGHLRSITEREDWEPWVLYMIEAVRRTAEQTLWQIRAIRDLMEKTAKKIREKAPKVYSRELVDVLFGRPYCKIGFLVDAKIAKRQTASEYLKMLEKVGVISSVTIGREAIYANNAFLRLLKKKPAEGRGG